MANWKIPDSPSFSALISFVKQTKKTSDANTSGVSGLQEDVQGLASKTSEALGQVDAALEEMDAAKADKGTAAAITIPSEGWTEDEGEYYIDLDAANVTASDRADITISPESAEAATTCGLCATSETLAGKIRLRSAEPPAEPLTAEYWTEKGA